MRIRHCRCLALLCLFVVCCLIPARAADENTTPATAPTTEEATPDAEGRKPEASEAAAEEEAAVRQIKASLDFYAGVSNMEGQRQFRDGFWAGYGLGYPSVANLSWDSGTGSSAFISLGLGDYKGQFITEHQPVEAWWKMPVGKTDLTIGKFWVPFGLYEWEGETKWGVLMEREIGKYNLAASVNYNDILHNANAYFRASRSWGENLTLGVSFAGGKGLSYGTVHDRGVGLDLTAAWRGFQLTSEYTVLQHHSDQRFQFGFARVSYENLGKWKPFVSRHTWHDKADELGNFHSTTAGIGYQLTPHLGLEAAYAHTPNKGIWWLQTHLTWEKVLRQRKIAGK